MVAGIDEEGDVALHTYTVGSGTVLHVVHVASVDLREHEPTGTTAVPALTRAYYNILVAVVTWMVQASLVESRARCPSGPVEEPTRFSRRVVPISGGSQRGRHALCLPRYTAQALDHALHLLYRNSPTIASPMEMLDIRLCVYMSGEVEGYVQAFADAARDRPTPLFAAPPAAASASAVALAGSSPAVPAAASTLCSGLDCCAG